MVKRSYPGGFELPNSIAKEMCRLTCVCVCVCLCVCVCVCMCGCIFKVHIRFIIIDFYIDKMYSPKQKPSQR